MIPRVGESRTNDEVSVGVGIRLGLDPQQWDPNPQRLRRLAMGDRVLPIQRHSGERHGAVPRLRFRAEGCSWSAKLKASIICRAYRPIELPDLPITLITPATSRTTSSMFGNIAPASADLHLHPADAAARGLSTGDRAQVTDGRHTIEAIVAVDATLAARIWPRCRRACGVVMATRASRPTCLRPTTSPISRRARASTTPGSRFQPSALDRAVSSSRPGSWYAQRYRRSADVVSDHRRLRWRHG